MEWLNMYQRYKHYKGGEYGLICTASMEATGEEVAVYFSLSTYLHYVRPLKEFKEKFTKITKVSNASKD